MGKRLRFTVSPLFLAFAIAVLLLFDAVLFAVYIASVLLHEYAHYLAALRFGLCMDEVKLYPFGAVLYGELSHLSLHEEILVALAGPLVNIVLAVLLLAAWWVVPEVYVYTDLAAFANVAIAAFNLLPFYPLDGGRVALNLMLKKMKPKKAFRVLYALSMCFAALLFALYILSLFYTANYSLGIASALIVTGAFGMRTETAYRKTYSVSFSARRLAAGLPVKHLAVRKDITPFSLITMLSSNCYYNILLLGENFSVARTLTHAELSALVCEEDMHTPIDQLLGI